MTNEERDRILQDFLESESRHDVESVIAAWPESNRAEIASDAVRLSVPAPGGAATLSEILRRIDAALASMLAAPR